MRDLLVRYLLGELDSQEQRLVEEKLQESAELRRELAYLRACLPSAEAELPPASELALSEPPRGLVERTCGRVVSDSDEYPVPVGGGLVALSPNDIETYTPTWSLADMTVAAGVFLAVSMLFLPALRQSRDCARRIDCADNERQFGQLMAMFSTNHNRQLPIARANENAGIVVLDLFSNGGIESDDFARRLVCKSSPLADNIKAGLVKMSIPASRAEFLQMPNDDRQRAQHVMAGSYAFQVGFIQDHQYHIIRDERSPYLPVLADAPRIEFMAVQIVSHRGCGQNVLFQDGSVRYQESLTLPQFNDNMFLNAHGRAEAGCGPQDIVLGGSEMMPIPVQFQTMPLDFEFRPTVFPTVDHPTADQQ